MLKPWNQCRARQSTQLPAAAKLAPGAKGGKLCNNCQAWQDTQLDSAWDNKRSVPGAGKLAASAKGGKLYNQFQARQNTQLDCLGEQAGKLAVSKGGPIPVYSNRSDTSTSTAFFSISMSMPMSSFKAFLYSYGP